MAGMDADTALADSLELALDLSAEEAFSLFITTAADHRDEAMVAGFSPEAAEAMGVSLHSGLVALYFAAVGQ